MKKTVILLILSALSLSAFSQSNVFRDLKSFTDQFRYEKIRNSTMEGSNYNDIEGSPFLNKDFIKGVVTLNDSIKFQDVPLRYNIYSDKMQFLTEGNIILEVDNSTGSFAFKIGSKTFKNKQYLLDDQEQQGILELLADGTYKLYKKYRMDFEPATKAKGFQDSEPDRFEREKEQYFISVKDGIPQLVMRKKDLEKILKPHNPEIGSYIKSQRIKVRSEEDLVKLIRHCNQ